MKKETFEDIRKEGRLLYEYIRGSKAYGISLPGSDTDTGGVYMEPIEQLFGIPSKQDEVSDEKHDTVWYRFGRYIELLKRSNPNILESLFIPDEFVIYQHPLISELKKHKNSFITKQCFPSFYGYSTQQLKKARSLAKKVVQPEHQEKPTLLGSIFTFYNQGSQNILDFLSERGLDQKYCGLVNIPNCTNNYSCFYDWGNHIKDLNINNCSDFSAFLDNDSTNLAKFIKSWFNNYSTEEMWFEFFKESQAYHGIADIESNQVRLSSVRKGEKPICIISYDPSAYTQRCIKYREWRDWMNNRNEERYGRVVRGEKFDKKNACHCVRLMNMAIEMARGEGVIVNRKGIDADFLLKVRTGNMSYSEIMEYLENKKSEMEDAMKKSNIPDSINTLDLEELVYNIRCEFYGNSSAR